jgi:hypothetical protein
MNVFDLFPNDNKLAEEIAQVKKVKEDNWHQPGADSWGGQDPFTSDKHEMVETRLQAGDPVIVTAPNEFEGKTGEISEFSPSGKFVVVNLYNYGEHSMHLSDIEYNQYADDEDKLDEDFGNSPVAGAITRRILMQRHDLLKQYGPELVGAAVDNVADYVGDVDEIGSSDVSGWVMQVERMLKENPPEAFGEGWSDRAVAQRTGQPRTPYSVYIKGKKWKDFENDDHAEAVANKLRAKFKAEGRDPSVITIAPTDMSESVVDVADQTKKVFKDKSGKPVGEIGIDPESSPGNGEWYVHHYATGYSVVGFDSAAEAKRELLYVHKHPDAVDGHPSTKEQGVAEGKADYNFDAEDLKRLERIRDLPTLKTQALALISRPSAKPMKPEKVEWFKNALDRMNSPIKVIKLMYDLLLSGEGHAVVGSKSSMNPNSYRQRFGEQDVAEDSRGSATRRGQQDYAKGLSRQQNPYYKSQKGTTPPEAYDWEAGWEYARDAGKEPNVAETVTNVRAGMAEIYRRLAPKIERHRDSFLAGQLYDELENYAELHGAEGEFKRMMATARNSAHMEYDTNPGGFQNWFWFLPFEIEKTESAAKLRASGLATKRDRFKSLRKESVQESYWTQLQNERSTRLNTLINEFKESVNK